MFEPVVFHVLAEASPGLLSRLLQPFARRDLVPDEVFARREGDMLHARLAMAGMPGEMVHLVAGNLRQIIGVVTVEQAAWSGAARREAA